MLLYFYFTILLLLVFFLSIIHFKYAHPTFTNHPVNAWKCCLNIMCEFHQRYPPGKEGRETLVISCHRIDAKLVLRQTMWKFHQITLDDECHRRKGEWERKKRVVFMYFWCYVIIGKYFQWKWLLYVVFRYIYDGCVRDEKCVGSLNYVLSQQSRWLSVNQMDVCG